MTISPLSPPSSSRGRFLASVASNTPICQDHFRLVLRLPSFPPTRPGHFVQVACRNLDLDCTPETESAWEPGAPFNSGGLELLAPLALLRRPFSLAGRRDVNGAVELDILYRTVGTGTAWMSRLRKDDPVHLIGPLGNHFTPPPPNSPAILIGGGVGIPPMLYLASELAGRRAVVFAGATTRDLLPLTITADAPTPAPDAVDPLYNIAEFAAHGIPAVITTDDGSFGHHGLVTDALQRYLDRYFPLSPDPASLTPPTLYTCGPEGMMKRVAAIALQRGLECQISVERAMACGMGTCQSCVIRVRKPDPSQPPLAGQDWCYRLACTDGPIFRAADLLW